MTKFKIPAGYSSLLMRSITKAVSNHPFFSVPGAAMVTVAGQLLSVGGNSEKLGQAIGNGVLLGLNAEKHHKHQRCPHCGRRHPLPTRRRPASKDEFKFGPTQ